MKKYLLTLLLFVGFSIAADAQTGRNRTVRSRTNVERRIERREIRRIRMERRQHRRRHHRRTALTNQFEKQQLHVFIYKKGETAVL